MGIVICAERIGRYIEEEFARRFGIRGDKI